MDQRERREKLEKLTSLDEIYIQVMYYRFLDKNVSQIKEILEISNEKTVWTRFTRIYEKLGIAGDDKEGELIREYSPIFLEFIKSEEDLNNWGHIRAEMLRQLSELHSSDEAITSTEIPSTSKSELPRAESEKSQKTSESLSTDSPSQASETQQGDVREGSDVSRPRPIWLIIAISVFVLCVLCISSVLFVWRLIPFSQATPTISAPTETRTQLPTNTKPVVHTQTSSPTITDTPISPTPTLTLKPTETPTVTNTSLPTETPTPAVEPLFFDDFTDGKSDMWQTIYGEPIIVDNALSFQATTLMVIDVNDWIDYEVSFDVSNMWCQGGVSSRGVTIGQRYQNANNMMALRIFHWGDNCNASWYLIKDGDWNKIKNASFSLPPKDSKGMRHFILSVEGNTYSSPFGVPLVIENFQAGGVALLADKGVIIDNFRVIPLDSQE